MFKTATDPNPASEPTGGSLSGDPYGGTDINTEHPPGEESQMTGKAYRMSTVEHTRQRVCRNHHSPTNGSSSGTKP
jgi:hypothetical protein